MKSDSPSPTAGVPTARNPPGLRARILGGALVLLVIAALGREFGHRLPELEHWIASQGFLGWVVFVAATMVCTSLFVPDTVFAVMAGVLYGVLGGTTIITVAVLLTASVNFVMARRWLFDVVRRWLERQPRLAAIERAVQREGLRLQFLIRLTPLSPVAVSYVLGTTTTRFVTFLTACVGLIPALFVEVYLGHFARHMVRVAHEPSSLSKTHTLFTVLSLALCLAVLAYISRIARKALAEAEAATAGNPVAVAG